MPYTVAEAYNRVLEEADKLGSDYFDKQQVLSVFKKETLDFVGSKAAEAELNQQVTDDIGQGDDGRVDVEAAKRGDGERFREIAPSHRVGDDLRRKRIDCARLLERSGNHPNRRG